MYYVYIHNNIYTYTYIIHIDIHICFMYTYIIHICIHLAQTGNNQLDQARVLDPHAYTLYPCTNTDIIYNFISMYTYRHNIYIHTYIHTHTHSHTVAHTHKHPHTDRQRERPART